MRGRGPEAFFAYARARHEIHLRRAAGQPKPWTDDRIFWTNKFTNVFRELDRTTVWFRERVRDPLREKPEVLMATVVFRMFNRVEVGEALFCQMEFDGGNAFDLFRHSEDVRDLRRAIRALCGDGPYVTGAYIISTPPGHSKLDGVLKILRDFYRDSDWRHHANLMLSASQYSLRETFEWLRQQPYLGTFHSYEIVTDLRHTKLLDCAPDRDTWANVGPGARRGLNRIAGRRAAGRRGRGGWGAPIPTEQALEEMRELLRLSRDARYWPQWSDRLGRYVSKSGKTLDRDMALLQSVPPKPAAWPEWELREVEHTLCEFDKYERVRLGEGRPRGKFNGGESE